MSKFITKKWQAVITAAFAALFCLALAGCSNDGGTTTDGDTSETPEIVEATEVTITDMAGRTVTIPTHPTRVMGAANPDGAIVYSIDPSLLVGWVGGVSDRAKPYLDAKTAALPAITSISKWEDPNEEELLSMDLDLVLVACDLNNTDYALYDDVTKNLGIPIVVIDADLNHWPDTYKFLATIFPDQAEQCLKCAEVAQAVIDDVAATMKKVGDNKVAVLYSTGDEGLQTCGDSNWNGAFLTASGAFNVCDTDKTSGFSTVSIEQILNWKPEMIISTASGDKTEIYSAADWADLPAIINNQVYAAPQAPFSWVDKPTGINRIIGVIWSNSIVYPDYVTYDIAQHVKDFYSTFYHYDLTDAEVAELLDTHVDLSTATAEAA